MQKRLPARHGGSLLQPMGSIMKNDYEKVPEEELIRRAKSGDEEAENVLLDHYKALVKKSARVLYLEGGDREDLLQEGMLGLFKAIKTFDFERGASFSTYAGQIGRASCRERV